MNAFFKKKLIFFLILDLFFFVQGYNLNSFNILFIILNQYNDYNY